MKCKFCRRELNFREREEGGDVCFKCYPSIEEDCGMRDEKDLPVPLGVATTSAYNHELADIWEKFVKLSMLLITHGELQIKRPEDYNFVKDIIHVREEIERLIEFLNSTPQDREANHEKKSDTGDH